ncbi:hypothetical protein COCSUDRAFT_63494 [Coccomyxa subellipsoidea C-169]|uniref:Uncharacterized protein n=1 Tax=Coccomyxa subellipsoidea (strain C-169) TaxID=574566 RepID=I0YXK7_COCSC|nr:hypothetical protein COCSUDRAFT_63494 [Coccomyxa subellipsoidea C-169]EIE23126.1 hypothetical protein COCSUDRAFT_63494 [Coccomyxa subellipsoidea C-169]|eukprot:XP_005647670.1 hypothetical protein COCSUDRAFT_63494 [Coccomyxa subellipsoidea C-169]
MQPHRRIQPDKFSHDAVLSEPLFFRHLTDAGGKPLAWEDWAGLDLVRISYLCHLSSGPEHQHSAIRHRLPTLLAALPASWRQLFQSHPAAALWQAYPDPPALVQHWHITWLWHPRTWKRQQPGAQEQEEDALVPLAAAPTLCSTGSASVLDPLRPAILADTTDDQRNGLEARRQSRAAATGTGTGVLEKRPWGEPDPSSYAAWMRPLRQRPAPWRDGAGSPGEPALPRSPDLLLADDTRVSEPPRQLRPLWQRLRLGRLSWPILRLASTNIRLSAGVLSDWLRGRDPTLSREEESTAHWCHRRVL